MKPQILLDIDGVLNTWPRHPKHMWDEFQEHVVCDLQTGKDYRIVVGQPVIDFFNEIHAQGSADIWWHTTWQNSANEVAKAFGLAEFRVLDAPEFDRWRARTEARSWWKLAAVKRVLMATEAPVIWIDDDAGMYWVRKLRDECLDAGMSELQWSLLTAICPDAQTGVSRAHMAKIEHIIDEWEK